MTRKDIKKIENKNYRNDIASDIQSIRSLKTISKWTKDTLIKDLLNIKQQTQDYDIKERLADAIQLEDSPFRVLDTTGWDEDEKKDDDWWIIKIKINKEKDIIENIKSWKQTFLTTEAFFREVSKAKWGISEEEIKEKYLITLEDLYLKAGKKRTNDEKYKKFYTKYIENNLDGYFLVDYDKFNDVDKAFYLTLIGSDNYSARFDKYWWSDAKLPTKAWFSVYLKKVS